MNAVKDRHILIHHVILFRKYLLGNSIINDPKHNGSAVTAE